MTVVGSPVLIVTVKGTFNERVVHSSWFGTSTRRRLSRSDLYRELVYTVQGLLALEYIDLRMREESVPGSSWGRDCLGSVSVRSYSPTVPV